MRPHDLAPGDVLASRFLIEAVLGTGATSSVYRARDRELENRAVALKILKDSFAASTLAARRFEREALLVARLHHPSIVALLANGWLPTGQPWLAFELVEGETLESVIERDRRVPLRRLVPLLSSVLDALEVAHAHRVLHRDLKPANLAVHTSDGVERAKLLDFGVSRDLAEGGERLTAPPQVIGTIGYLAPEQLVPGGGEPDERADLWAAGVVFYRALTGQAPFGLRAPRAVAAILEADPPPPSSLVPDATLDVDAFVQRALAKDRESRFRNATAMRNALHTLTA